MHVYTMNIAMNKAYWCQTCSVKKMQLYIIQMTNAVHCCKQVENIEIHYTDFESSFMSEVKHFFMKTCSLNYIGYVLQNREKYSNHQDRSKLTTVFSGKLPTRSQSFDKPQYLCEYTFDISLYLKFNVYLSLNQPKNMSFQ